MSPALRSLLGIIARRADDHDRAVFSLNRPQPVACQFALPFFNLCLSLSLGQMQSWYQQGCADKFFR